MTAMTADSGVTAAEVWLDDEDPGPLTLRQAWEMLRYLLRSVLGGAR